MPQEHREIRSFVKVHLPGKERQERLIVYGLELLLDQTRRERDHADTPLRLRAVLANKYYEIQAMIYKRSLLK